MSEHKKEHILSRGITLGNQYYRDLKQYQKHSQLPPEMEEWINDVLGVIETGEKFRRDINSPLKKKQFIYNQLIKTILLKKDLEKKIRQRNEKILKRKKFAKLLAQYLKQKYAAFEQQAQALMAAFEKKPEALEKPKEDKRLSFNEFLKLFYPEQFVTLYKKMVCAEITIIVREKTFVLLNDTVQKILEDSSVSESTKKQIIEWKDVNEKKQERFLAYLDNLDNVFEFYKEMNDVDKIAYKQNLEFGFYRKIAKEFHLIMHLHTKHHQISDLREDDEIKLIESEFEKNTADIKMDEKQTLDLFKKTDMTVFEKEVDIHLSVSEEEYIDETVIEAKTLLKKVAEYTKGDLEKSEILAELTAFEDKVMHPKEYVLEPEMLEDVSEEEEILLTDKDRKIFSDILNLIKNEKSRNNDYLEELGKLKEMIQLSLDTNHFSVEDYEKLNDQFDKIKSLNKTSGLITRTEGLLGRLFSENMHNKISPSV